jgi:hypothetical protein
MTQVFLAAADILLTAAGSELALRRRKMQTGLWRVLVIWISGYAAAAAWLVRHGHSGVVVFTIFWSGTFLAWFGMRSHIESSIVLRMLFLLRQRPMTDAELIAAYASHYGEAARVEELHRGGLVVRGRDGIHVTPKGKTVLLFASKLR